MGEVINNLLRAFAIIGGIVFVLIGLHFGVASLGVDIAHDYDSRMAVGQSERSAKLQALATDLDQHHWRWTWRVAVHPHSEVAPWALVFPWVKNPGQIGRGDYFNPVWMTRTFTQERMINDFLPPVLIGLGLTFVLEFIAYPLIRSRVARSLADDSNGVFGSARDLPRGDGFVLAKNVRLARDGGGNPHVLTIGSSGSGKSACQVIPSLLSLPSDCGAVCTDPKEEILARAGLPLQRQGHQVIVLGPKVGHGTGWDPLLACKSADDCRELGRQLIVGGDESEGAGSGGNWNNMSRTCLSAYLIQAWADGRGLADALIAMYGDEASGKSITDESAMLDYRQFETLAGGQNTKASVLATIQGACQVWLIDQVVGWMRCPRQFKMESLRKGAVVFLVTNAADARATRAIQRVFFARLFDFLADSDGADVRVLADEMGNLGKLDGLDQALNLLRSAGVGIHAFVQNVSQLFQVYGRDAGAVVAESFGTITIMAGLRNDGNDLAKLLGEREDVKASYSTQDEKMRAQFGQQRRQVIDGAMLRQIARDEVLIVSGNRKPVMAKLKPWFKIRKLRNRVVPKVMRKDWRAIPPEAKKVFFDGIKKIDPVRIVLPEKPKSGKSDANAEAVAPHIQKQVHETKGESDRSDDPFASLNAEC